MWFRPGNTPPFYASTEKRRTVSSLRWINDQARVGNIAAPSRLRPRRWGMLASQRNVMQFGRLIYYMSVAGCAAGLACWAIMRLLVQAAPGAFSPFVLDLLAASILGGALSGTAVGFGDKWSTGSIVPRWVLTATAVGILSGLAGGMLALLLKRSVGGSMFVNRVLTWSVVGG